jgi:hypothetical protein
VGVRRRAAVAVAARVAVGCGGGSSPTATATPPASGGSAKLVVLDSGNFESLVLGAPRPSLVKFQSPT